MIHGFLAHGALGVWDEVFLLLAIGIFVVMLAAPMVGTWIRRHAPLDPSATTPDASAAPEAPDLPLDSPVRRRKNPASSAQFRLE